MPVVIHLRAGHEKPLRRRHPWLFSGAIARIEGEAGAEAAPGDAATCRAADGTFLAHGYVNPKTSLAFRAVSFDEATPMTEALIVDRIARAIARRLPLVPRATNAYRLVHAEADGLPGLVVDRFAGTLVCQITTAGMGRFEDAIGRALAAELAPQAILVKVPRRQAQEEGIAQGTRSLIGDLPTAPVRFTEHGVPLSADLVTGQKTGFYLDQREHRKLARDLAAGRKVLDAFCYTGGFALCAALGGATHVTAVDSSKPALDTARAHFAESDVPAERFTLVAADVGDYMRRDVGPFDLIILDPPPLAHGKATVPQAARAYKDHNLQALKHLAPGGLLLTFSCSQAVDADLLSKIVFGAALDAGVDARVLAHLAQPFDHPVSVYHPEGEYLRGLLLQVG
jgi:23S rRNA (cytosine1962-C5)-methyltransferase